MIEGPILWGIITAVFAAGSAWGGVKIALNGTRKQVSDLSKICTENTVHVAQLETKVDMIYEIVKHG